MKRSTSNYVPDRGDMVWITLNPTAGHEQDGRRPAMVVSPRSYNHKTGLCVLCPATRQAKGYAFEVDIANADGTSTVVLADHLRNVDWKARNIQFIRRLSHEELSEVVARIEALLDQPRCLTTDIVTGSRGTLVSSAYLGVCNSHKKRPTLVRVN